MSEALKVLNNLRDAQQALKTAKDAIELAGSQRDDAMAALHALELPAGQYCIRRYEDGTYHNFAVLVSGTGFVDVYRLTDLP